MRDKCFDWAVDRLVKMEGGYKPVKLKGETDITVAGIYRKWHPEWEGWELLGDPTKLRGAVRKFYYQQYWIGLSCNRMPCPFAFALFNLAVLMGSFHAVRLLQQAVNSSCRTTARIKVDGIVGSETLGALRSCEEEALLVISEYVRLANLRLLALPKPEFYRGWTNRAHKVLQEVIRWHLNRSERKAMQV